MCQGSHSNGKGEFCLLGWAEAVFLQKSETYPYNKDFKRLGYDRVMKALLSAAHRLNLHDLGWTASVMKINDSVCQSNAMRARVWNKGMAILGYTEGNPETAK